MKHLFLFAILATLASCTPQPEAARFKTITVRAQGNVETVPNQATFYVYLNCNKSTSKQAKECLIANSKELTDTLIKLGAAPNDLLTTNISLERWYDYTSKGSVFKGYIASTSIQITVKNMDNLERMYTELLDNRQLEISGLSYNHNAMEELEANAHIEALKNANVIAQKILSQLPESKLEVLKVGNIELTASIPEASDNVRNTQNIAYETAQEEAPTVSINTGTIKVGATIFVEYLIK